MFEAPDATDESGLGVKFFSQQTAKQSVFFSKLVQHTVRIALTVSRARARASHARRACRACETRDTLSAAEASLCWSPARFLFFRLFSIFVGIHSGILCGGESERQKTTVRFPCNDSFLPRSSKMSSSCQKSIHNATLFINLKHPVIDFAREQCVLLSALGFESFGELCIQ